MATDGGGKHKEKRHHKSTPYDRPVSFLNRFKDTVKGILSPSWMIGGYVNSSGNSEDPDLEYEQENPSTSRASTIPHRDDLNYEDEDDIDNSSQQGFSNQLKNTVGSTAAPRLPINSRTKCEPSGNGGVKSLSEWRPTVNKSEKDNGISKTNLNLTVKSKQISRNNNLFSAPHDYLNSQDDFSSGSGNETEDHISEDEGSSTISTSLQPPPLSSIQLPPNRSWLESPDWMERSLLSEPSSSTFNKRQTSFDEESAAKRHRTETGISYNFTDNAQLKAKPFVDEHGGDDVMSANALKILNTLAKMSTPLNDAKKVPIEKKSEAFLDETLSLTPSYFRRRPSSLASNQIHPNSKVLPVAGPSKSSLPAQPRVFGMRHVPNSKEVKDASTATSFGNLLPFSQPAGGKMKSSLRDRQHYSVSRDDEYFESLDFPSDPLPITNLPKFNLTSTTTNSRSSVSSNQTLITPSQQFSSFSSPFSLGTTSGNKSLSDKGEFSFSSSQVTSESRNTPISILGRNSPISALMASVSSSRRLRNQPKESLKKLSNKSGSKSCSPGSPVASTSMSKLPLGVADELVQGSVMDVLGSGNKGNISNVADKLKTAALQCNSCKVRINSDEVKCISCESAKSCTTEIPVKVNGFGEALHSVPGTWECNTCFAKNSAERKKCLDCDSPRPGSMNALSGSKPYKFGQQSSQKTESLFGSPSSSSGSSLLTNSSCGFGETFKQPRNETDKPAASLSSPSSLHEKGFGSQFVPAVGLWECASCMVRNKTDVTKCIACETPKPGNGNSSAPSETSTFKFGLPSSQPSGAPLFKCTATTVSDSALIVSSSSSSGFKFGASSDSLASTAVKESVPQNGEPAVGGFKFDLFSTKAETSTQSTSLNFSFPKSSENLSTSSSVPTTTTTSQSASLLGTGFFGLKTDGPLATLSSETTSTTSTSTQPTVGGFKFTFGQDNSPGKRSAENDITLESPKKSVSFSILPISSSSEAPPSYFTSISTPAAPFGATPGLSFGTSAPSAAVASGLSFGTSAPSATIASGLSFGTSAPSAAVAPGLSFGTSTPSAAVAPVLSFGSSAPSASVAPGLSFGTPAPNVASTVASQPGFGAGLSFNFGGASATPSTTASSTAVFGQVASSTQSVSTSNNLFTFGASNQLSSSSASVSAPPPYTINTNPPAFGAATTNAGTPSFNFTPQTTASFTAPQQQSTGFNFIASSAPATTTSNSSSLFTFGQTNNNNANSTSNTSNIFTFGASTSLASANYPATTPSFGQSGFGSSGFGGAAPAVSAPAMFGGGSTAPASNAWSGFGSAPTQPPAIPQSGGFSFNQPQGQAYQFGQDTSAQQSGVFTFGSAQQTAPAPSTSQPSGGFSFGLSTPASTSTPAFNSGLSATFGGISSAPSATSTPAFNPGIPTNFNFSASTPAAPTFQFNAAAAPAGMNPFDAVNNANRKIKKATRRFPARK